MDAWADWANVSNSFRTSRQIGELLFGFGFLYLFVKKKFTTFLFFAIALFSNSVLSYILTKEPWGVHVATLIGLLLIAFILSWKELVALDQTGKKAYEVFKWDNVDRLVLSLLFIAWIMIRFVFHTRGV